MKNLLVGLLSGAVVASVIAAPPAMKTPGARAMVRNAPAFDLVPDPAWREFDRVPNRVFAKFRPTVGEAAFDAVLADMDATISSTYRLVPGLFCLETAGDEAAVIEAFADRGDVLEFIEPVFTMEFFDNDPNDPNYSQLYGLQRINAPDAWEEHVGEQEFAIAVIDSGSDINHPDLIENLWVNVDEVPGNGIDDDGNGEVDDIHGFDYYDNDPNPSDQNGHGTHTAGTIGARGDNGDGVVGVNWRCSLMPLRVGNQSLSSQAILDSLEYACVNGAKVSNNSYGGGGFSGAFNSLIQSAGTNYNHIFCAAAGNGGSNGASYPAAYDQPNILSVAATDSDDNLASFSQYGSNVDLAAPGVQRDVGREEVDRILIHPERAARQQTDAARSDDIIDDRRRMVCRRLGRRYRGELLMVLHMLYGTAELTECVALLTSADSVIVMEPAVIIDTKTLSSLPCPAFALDTAAFTTPDDENLPRIDVAKWVELTSRYSHSMTWR